MFNKYNMKAKTDIETLQGAKTMLRKNIIASKNLFQCYEEQQVM